MSEVPANRGGPPKGNRNAVLHGLYSRRLQVCGTHCPRWESCPCAQDDILELAPKERGEFVVKTIEEMRPSTKGQIEVTGVHSWAKASRRSSPVAGSKTSYALHSIASVMSTRSSLVHSNSIL